MSLKKPVVLCILDGWGLRAAKENNAPALAHTPNFDKLIATCPNDTLITYGPDVGLPKGQMGNSEVGHMNIGAGRVVAMDLGQIDLAIEDGSFFKNSALMAFAQKIKAGGGVAHIAGLVSSGGVHSHQSHLLAAAQALVQSGLKVAIHAITDGRDVAPSSALGTMEEFISSLPKGAEIVSVSGRYFAMDRDNRWERVSQAYFAMVQPEDTVKASPLEIISQAYEQNITDEFIKPVALDGYEGMKDGDGLFFINFRADRARELLSAIADPDFNAFKTGPRPALSSLLGMVEYSDRHNSYMEACYPKEDIKNTLAQWISQQQKTQFHIAETEKYPHVTFFLNGGNEAAVAGEERYMAASPKVATYDLQPEMSAPEVSEHFVDAIKRGFDFIVCNFANPDMVGHTGDLEAAIKACEAVDLGLGQVVEALGDVGGQLLVIADHGNCETMVDPETGGPHTAHTLNPVPVILYGAQQGVALRSGGRLADVAPTILELMALEQPKEMTGKSLLI